MREFSQVDRLRLKADARERQNKRRAEARAKGYCCICCVNPVTEGLNPQLEPYSTCERCRTKSAVAVERQRERDRNRVRKYVKDPKTGLMVQRWVVTGKTAPVVHDRFCVECQAHGFHRADCPTLTPRKKRAPQPSQIVEAAA